MWPFGSPQPRTVVPPFSRIPPSIALSIANELVIDPNPSSGAQALSNLSKTNRQLHDLLQNSIHDSRLYATRITNGFSTHERLMGLITQHTRPHFTSHLMWAVHRGDFTSVFDFVVSAKRGCPDPEILERRTTDRFTQTALAMAVRQGKDAIVECLARAGADVESVDSCGMTPLHIAVKSNRASMVSLLLREGANVNAIVYGSAQETVLHLAAATGNTEILALLGDHNIDILALDSEAREALHTAAYHGHFGAVRFLMRHGATFRPDQHSKSPIPHAFERRHPQVFSYLIGELATPLYCYRVRLGSWQLDAYNVYPPLLHLPEIFWIAFVECSALPMINRLLPKAAEQYLGVYLSQRSAWYLGAIVGHYLSGRFVTFRSDIKGQDLAERSLGLTFFGSAIQIHVWRLASIVLTIMVYRKAFNNRIWQGWSGFLLGLWIPGTL